MREIEFRGKQRWSGEWMYGDLSQLAGKNWAWIKKDQYVEPVLPETVGQFTGLYDNQKSKIFEHDVIEARQHYYIVKWQAEECCFVFGKSLYHTFDLLDSKTAMKVIGNIHDNLELLDTLHD